MAMDAEQEAIDYYNEIKENTPDPEVKKILNIIIDQEKIGLSLVPLIGLREKGKTSRLTESLVSLPIPFSYPFRAKLEDNLKRALLENYDKYKRLFSDISGLDSPHIGVVSVAEFTGQFGNKIIFPELVILGIRNTFYHRQSGVYDHHYNL